MPRIGWQYNLAGGEVAWRDSIDDDPGRKH